MNALDPEYQNMQFIVEDAARQLSTGGGVASSEEYPSDFDEQLRELIDSVPVNVE